MNGWLERLHQKMSELKQEIVAAALKYFQDGAAPILVESGRGLTAARILEVARLHNIPIVESDVAPLLARLEKNTPIDEKFFEVIARIYARLIQMDQYPGTHHGKN